MKKSLGIISLSALLLFAVSAMAHEKVVVIPLSGKKATVAPVAKTGQTPTLPITAPAGSDGDLQKGVAWPNPRFTDNTDGTVTDNLTGLVWLKNANCFGVRTWTNALSDSDSLADGICSLTDGSVAGAWRLPNKSELNSLIDIAYFSPALSNADGTGQWTEGSAFVGVLSGNCWTSSPSAVITDRVWSVALHTGTSSYVLPASTYCVWPVRD